MNATLELEKTTRQKNNKDACLSKSWLPVKEETKPKVSQEKAPKKVSQESS